MDSNQDQSHETNAQKFFELNDHQRAAMEAVVGHTGEGEKDIHQETVEKMQQTQDEVANAGTQRTGKTVSKEEMAKMLLEQRKRDLSLRPIHLAMFGGGSHPQKSMLTGHFYSMGKYIDQMDYLTVLEEVRADWKKKGIKREPVLFGIRLVQEIHMAALDALDNDYQHFRAIHEEAKARGAHRQATEDEILSVAIKAYLFVEAKIRFAATLLKCRRSQAAVPLFDAWHLAQQDPQEA